jgi:hypothetical protein
MAVFLFLSPIVRAGVYLLLGAAFLMKPRLARLWYVTCLVAGLFILWSNIAPFLTPSPTVIAVSTWEPLLRLRLAFLHGGFASSLLQTVGFITVLGLVGLLSKRPEGDPRSRQQMGSAA